MSGSLPSTQTAVKWYPPSFDVRIETVPVPQIEHPDDAIVKIQLAGLCGSDLHVYRGLEDVHEPHICGHEFVGHVIALGSSFSPESLATRPPLYRTLLIGDKVVSPFTTSCGECQFCRLGFTARCSSSQLFGSPALPGAQAQYVRVPHAGGTLLVLPAPSTLPDTVLLLLADILPTGLFVVLQALAHPKLAPVLGGRAWPQSAFAQFAGVDYGAQVEDSGTAPPTDEDRVLTVAVVGLGPVGLCAVIALLDFLTTAHRPAIPFRLLAVDLNTSRTAKVQQLLSQLTHDGQVFVGAPDDAKQTLQRWRPAGCHAVIEAVGNPSALTLAHALLAPAGILASCGVHQAPPLPFTGAQMYDANATLEFGRCSVRALLGAAQGLLARRRGVLGAVVERVLPLAQAAEAYARFERGECGKVVFDPWA